MTLRNPGLLPTVMLFVFGGCCMAPEVDPTTGVDPAQVVRTTKAALVSTQKRLVELGMPPLAEVKVTLTLVAKSEGGPEFTVLVLSAGNTHTEEQTQKMTFTLSPPDHTEDEDVANADLYQSLVNAIAATALAQQEIADAATSGDPKLEIDSVATSVKFSVADKGTRGIALEVLGAEIGGERARTNTATHEIEITFEVEDED